jgi:hypothetical protein
MRPLSAVICPHRGRPVLFVNGQPIQPVFYSLTDFPGGRWTGEELPRRNLSLFAEQGFSLFQVDLMLEHLWTSERRLDIGPARRQIRGVRDVCPAAAVVIRLHVNAPPWWNEAHPEECVGYADGPVDSPRTRGIERPLDRDLERSLRQSLASRRWKEEAGAEVREVCRRLSRTPEGAALIGIHISCGVFGEWAYFGFIAHEPDIGPAMTGAFREWLSGKYGGDAALRSAWADDSASLSTAAVPGVEERMHTSDGIFRDPRRERRVIDYFQCQHETLAESALHFCRLVKESWPRPLLTGIFYGYMFSQFGRQAAGGHLDIARILGSPDIDYLAGPQTYQPYSREIGGTGMSRGLPESCALHGKLWLDEMDQPTHLGSVGDKSYSCTLPDAVSLLRRNVAHPLLRGHGLWYYDFGPRFCSGWWDDPVLIAEIRRLKEFFDRRMERDYDSPADVLLLCDMEIFYYTGHSFASDPVSEPALDQLASALYHSGVSFAMAWLCDLEIIDWSRYRAILFANTWLLKPSQIAFIRDKVAKDGRHLLWVYAPGYTDGHHLDTASIAEVTGIAIGRTDIGEPARACGLAALPSRVEPLFASRDAGAETIQTFEATDIPAVVKKVLPTHTAWFFSLPPVEPEPLRRTLRESGAHIYSDAGDVLFGGGGLLCVHTLRGGPRTITLASGREVRTTLAPRSTTFFDSVTGATLLPDHEGFPGVLGG